MPHATLHKALYILAYPTMRKFYLLLLIRCVVRLRLSFLSSSSSSLLLELDLVDVRDVVVGRVRELLDEERLTLCVLARVDVDLDDETDELRGCVRTVLLLRKVEFELLLLL